MDGSVSARRGSRVTAVVLAGLFAALTAVGAFIRIPLGPLALTLQVFFTAMAGVLLGPRLGALSQVVYVALGLFGLPVFTQGGGIGYVLQPSFGYLIGLIPAAWVVGRLAGDGRGRLRVFLACMAGTAAVYAVGVPYLYIVMTQLMGASLTPSDALWTGMVLFLPGDLLKALCVSVLAPRIVPRIRTK